MQRERKVWGDRFLIRKDSTHANSFLEIRKGFECSWHKHQEKYNLFFVISGVLRIVTKQFDGKHFVDLTQNEFFTTKPGEMHKFTAIEDSQVIEEMYVEYRESDIQRENTGGKVSDSELPKCGGI